MIVTIKRCVPEEDVHALVAWLEQSGAEVSRLESDGGSVFLLSGGPERDKIAACPVVEAVAEEPQPFKLAGKRGRDGGIVVSVGGVPIGPGQKLAVIAGPCSVEGAGQAESIAQDVKMAGATLLRGGAYKPRTSPYSFSGLGEEGLKALRSAKEKTGLPVVSEMMSESQAGLFFRICGHGAGRRKEYAEHSPAQSGGEDGKAGPAEKRGRQYY